MNLKIYQAYFKNDQIPLLDSVFTPLDNTENLHPELREYAINLKAYNLAVAAGADMWGTFSYHWRSKIMLMDAEGIFRRIEDNPGYDVYFFNGHYDQVVLSYNVWEQGQWHHKNILKIVEYLFPKLGIDSLVLLQPMGRNHMFFSCHCVASKEFWDGFLDLATRYYNEIENLPNNIKELHNGSANYPGDLSAWYFPFIHERLFSTYLFINKHKFKALPYHDGENYHSYQYFHELTDLKERALLSQDSGLLESWRERRNQIPLPILNAASSQSYFDMAEYFIPYFIKT